MSKLQVRSRVVLGLAFLSVWVSAIAQLSGALQMKVTPALGVMVARSNVQSLRIEVTNKGDATSGNIEVLDDGPVVRIPVELPKNSTKVFVTTTPLGQFSFQAEVRLVTGAGIVQEEVPNDFALPVLLVGDSASAKWLEQLVSNPEPPPIGSRMPRRFSGQSTGRYTELDPRDAPTRALAYRGVPLVVLRDGAQRLSDDQVLALQTYLLRGGNIIIFGGASGSVLRDQRWGQLLGTSDWRPDTLSPSQSSQTLLTKIGSGKLQPVAISVGPTRLTPIEQHGGKSVAWRGSIGLGNLVVTAFDPTDSPLDTATRRVGYFQRLSNEHLNQALAGISVENAIRPTLGEAVKPPEFSSILVLLVVFAILAVPVNLAIVRKLKRAHLAWITAPILGIGFSFLVMNQATEVRGLATGKGQAGNMIADSRVPTASYRGVHRYFFKNGGRYDLKFKDVDGVATPVREDEFFDMRRGRRNERSQIGELGLVDDGTISAKAVNASSLGFFEFEVTKMVKIKPFFSVSPRPGKPNLRRFSVKNLSPYPISEVSIKDMRTLIPKTKVIQPGESFEVESRITDPAPQNMLIMGYIVGFAGVDGDSPLAPGQGNQRIRLYYRQFLEGA